MSDIKEIYNAETPVEKRFVFNNAFKYVDSYGIPLDCLIDEIHTRGGITNLTAFVADALSAGWTAKKAIAVANEAVNNMRGRQRFIIFWEKFL